MYEPLLISFPIWTYFQRKNTIIIIYKFILGVNQYLNKKHLWGYQLYEIIKAYSTIKYRLLLV